MQVPLQLDLQDMEPEAIDQEEIARHLEKLEARFGRITACRVVIKGPGRHHRTGGQFEVNIWMSLPDGSEIAVVRTPHQDERHSQLAFAINDAFRRARRRLQDRVRRMQNTVAAHGGSPIGTVTHLSDDKTFGFLTTIDGREIYFHRNSVLNGHYPRLKVGARVSFSEEAGEKGAQASTVHLIGRHAMRL